METEYIESYFEQTLNSEERTVFENRINNDKDFASDVAFYVSARYSLRKELLEQKETVWAAKDNSTNVEENATAALPTIAPVKKIRVSKWLSYVAAACLLLFVGLYFFERKSETPQQLAGKYVATEIQASLTMDASKDSLQAGKTAFADQQYEKALSYFMGVAAAHPSNIEAKELIGNVYLVTNNYDKALQQFDDLANIKGLADNEGLFMKAVTLLQRNKAGDLAEAKKLLEQVVKEGLSHNTEAAEWLKKF